VLEFFEPPEKLVIGDNHHISYGGNMLKIKKRSTNSNNQSYNMAAVSNSNSA
jgi:hypothetical protein